MSAFILGLIGGVIPGPVLTATFTEILRFDFDKSLRIIVWAMLAETVVALVSLEAFSSFSFSESIFRGLSFLGAAVLIWISLSIWRVQRTDTGEELHFSPARIAAMILANGVLWTFWITVCVPKAVLLGDKIYLGQFIFLVLVEVGWLVSTVLVAFLFSRFRGVLSNPKFVPVIFKIFSLIFLYFAVDMLYTSFTFFFGR